MTQPPAVPVPPYSLYDDRSVWIATLFGSPVAGPSWQRSTIAGSASREPASPWSSEDFSSPLS